MKIVFDDCFNNPRKHGVKEYHSISHPRLLEYMPKQFPKYMENKKRLNIGTKLMVPGSFSKNPPKAYASDSHRETRYLPTSFQFDGTLIIYGSKVAMISHRDNEVYSMIITSRPIAEMLDAIYVCLWDMLPQTK